MNSSGDQVEQDVVQLLRMYRALAELRSRVQPQSASSYELLAEGPVEEIQRLQREIDAYLGISSVAATTEGGDGGFGSI